MITNFTNVHCSSSASEKWDGIVRSATMKSSWERELVRAVLIGFFLAPLFLALVFDFSFHDALCGMVFTLKFLVPVCALLATFGRFILLPGLALILRQDVACRYLNLFVHLLHTIPAFEEWHASRAIAVPLSPPRFSVPA